MQSREAYTQNRKQRVYNENVQTELNRLKENHQEIAEIIWYQMSENQMLYKMLFTDPAAFGLEISQLVTGQLKELAEDNTEWPSLDDL